MARILQDGFECEGKEYSETKIEARQYLTTIKLDNCDLIFSSDSNSGFAWLKHGYCEPRGGFGKKGYHITSNCSVTAYIGTAFLKYDLTKLCNDTSELYYRVWFNPIYQSVMQEHNIVLGLAHTVCDEGRMSSNAKNFVFRANYVKVSDIAYNLVFYIGNTVVYEYKDLHFNVWTKLDVRYKVGDAQNGIMQFRINDKLITSYYGDTGTMLPKFMYIGGTNYNNNASIEMMFDDIAINDTTGTVNNSWCGNGSIVGIVPTSNGSKTMFEPLDGTQNFENVDDLQNDGDGSYNTSYALNDIDLFKFTIPESYGIPPTETINAISITTSAKFVEQPTAIGHIIKENGTESLVNQTNLSNDYTAQSSIVQEKSSGGKFKVSDIENLEFGYQTLEAIETAEE